MKHPFWILNSSLVILLLFAALFVAFSRPSLPKRESIEPELAHQTGEKTVSINIAKIYENDLFSTYKKEMPQQEKEDQGIKLPEPPRAKAPVIPAPSVPQFLDPLAITLRGIIIVRHDSDRNRAIIADDKTASETTYKVGDTIEDAQLIRIFSNKVIFLRSNGQQEVLYLREQDAKLDPVYAVLDGWDTVIQTADNQKFLVNSSSFTQRVKTLAQFIDMLKLTTSYKKGVAVGARVGQLDQGSMGSYLGLINGDIIRAIDGVPTISAQDRMKIYKDIIQKKDGDTITVSLLRRKIPIELTYTLKKFGKQTKDVTPLIEKFSQEEKMKAMQENHKFAPTLNQIRDTEKEIMMQKGKRPSSNF